MTAKKEIMFPSLIKVALVVLIGVVTITFQVDNVKAAEPMGNDWKDLIISPSEKKALDEFRGKVVHRLPDKFMKTEFYLIRWLRAKNFNQAAAQEMLLENVKWRKRNNMSGILHEDFSDVRDDFVLEVSSHDKKFRPIGTAEVGAWDIRAAVLQGKGRRFSRYLEYFLETIFQNILSAQMMGKNVTRGRLLYNMDGLNLVQSVCPACLPLMVQAATGLEAHYPGFFEEIILINAPPVISVALDVIRPVMSKENSDSLKVFTANRRQWMAYLDQIIDRDQRTETYGGTKRS